MTNNEPSYMDLVSPLPKNNEQLRAEFEAWRKSPDGVTIHSGAPYPYNPYHVSHPAFEAGYQAAAKSRDELIGKLKVQLLRTSWLLARAEVSLKDARYVHTAEDCANIINDIQQALAAIQPYLTKEGD